MTTPEQRDRMSGFAADSDVWHFPCGSVRRHDGFMTVRRRRQLGWVVFAGALIGTAGYMVTVGWAQASLIATVAGFFVAVAGLAAGLAAGSSSPAERPAGITMVMREVSGIQVIQEAVVPSEVAVRLEMAHVTGRSGPVRQRTSVSDLHAARDKPRPGSDEA